MRFFSILIYLLCLSMPEAFASAVNNKCTPADIAAFNEAYVKMQNSLKYEGRNIELVNGKIKAVGENDSTDNSPGKKIEQALYNQYKNALIKVGKVYQKINKEPSAENGKILSNNPEIVKFFKAIDSGNADPKAAGNINLNKLIDSLKKNEVKDFELTNEDVYLLKKLFAHSQDHVCRLEKYEKKKKNDAYLATFSKAPINKMIESLITLSGNNDLQLANEDIAISEAVKDSMAQMRKIIQDKKDCLSRVKSSPILIDIHQKCNYEKFLNSIAGSQFNEIESILHFLNSNQYKKDARTGIDWINTQFKIETIAKCIPDSSNKFVNVIDMPLRNGKIDFSKFSCSNDSGKLSREDCEKALDIKAEHNKVYKIGLKKTASPVTTFSITGISSCNNLSFAGDEPVKPEQPPVIPPVEEKTCNKESCEKMTGVGIVVWDEKDKACYSTPVGKEKTKLCSEPAGDPVIPVTPPVKSDEEKCKEDPKKEWKDNKCAVKAIVETPLTEAEKCKKADDEWTSKAKEGEVRGARHIWDGKSCVDKMAVKAEAEVTIPEAKPDAVYPNKPIPGRFQPITIPTRQIYILPGMP